MKAIQVKFIVDHITPAIMALAECEHGSSQLFLTGEEISISSFVRSAAMKLTRKHNYRGTWLGNELPSGDWAFLCIEPDTDLVIGVMESQPPEQGK